MFSGCLVSAGRPSVDTYIACRDISVISVGISMKMAINIHHVSGNY